VVQFAHLFSMSLLPSRRLDGREQIGAATGGVLCGGFLPGKRNLHIFDLGAYWPNSS
jgi:hypothetical protein